MKSRAAGVAAILLLLTAFTVARLQAQNEEIKPGNDHSGLQGDDRAGGPSVGGGT